MEHPVNKIEVDGGHDHGSSWGGAGVGGAIGAFLGSAFTRGFGHGGYGHGGHGGYEWAEHERYRGLSDQIKDIHSDQNKNEIIKDVDRTDHDVRCVEKELCEVKTCMAAGFTKLDGEVKGVYGYIDKQTEIIKELFLKEELRREREKVCELKELVEKKDTDCKFSKVFELIGDVKHRIARDEQRQETAHEYKHLLRDIACIIKKNTPAEETQG